MRTHAALVLLLASVACTQPNIVECENNATCDYIAGGVCRVNEATGHQWCSFPDATCPSGFRWGDTTVGDDLAGTCVDSGPADARPPCDQRVGWSSKRNGGDSDVFVGKLDGSAQVDLSDNNNDDDSPRWSPTGNRVAYSRLNGGTSSIWLMNTDGTDQHPITMDDPDIWPVWSPDGTKLLFDRLDPQLHLWVIDVDGSVPAQLSTVASAIDAYPAWSPDGSRIAFFSNRGGTREIWMMDSDGTNASALTTGDQATDDLEATVQWSADGSQLLYLRNDVNIRADVWVMDAAGGNQRNLTQSTNDTELHPRWLGDGRIVFTRFNMTSGGLYVMNADGTGQMLIAADGAQPEVSPDGTQLVWEGTGDGNKEIYVSALDGANAVRVTNDPADDFWPAWVPCP